MAVEFKACSVPGCKNNAHWRARGALGMCSAHHQRIRRSGSAEGTGKALRGAPAEYLQTTVLGYKGQDCLIWPYSRNASGYATIYAPKGETTIVSRSVCELTHGPCPSDKHEAAHSCGKGHEGCVNPNHLSWKSSIENSDDKRCHGTFWRKSRGEAHVSAKLTENQVREIRQARGTITTAQMAARYGVKPETIKAIYSRKTWKHVK